MNKIERWFNLQKGKAIVFGANIEVIHAKALAIKVANMSRAEMTTMRTYFRKEVDWTAKKHKIPNEAKKK